MRMVSNTLMASLAITLLVSACGGGGGGNSAPSSTPEPNPTPEPTPPQLFSLSGAISASVSQAVDGDTNDLNSEGVSNNTTASAQAIPNPITLGGYVNQPGTGAEGRSQLEGDTEDFFRVELLAGQSVTMLVADFAQADADLYLWNEQGTTVLDSSNEIGEVETLVIPQDGTYLVNAQAFDGATNYILAIGAPDTTGQQSNYHHKIVPWQTVVKYRDDTESPGATHSRQEIAQGLGMEQRAGDRGRARLMALRHGQVSARQVDKRLGTAAHKLGNIRDPELRAYWETMLAIKSLRKDPQVQYAEPNYEIRAMSTPNDEAYPLQWHYPLIGLPAAWDTSTGNPDVVVAVIDTGILSGHPDLAGQLVDGYDFVSDPDSALDGDGIDPNPRDPGSSFGGGSSSFHGTHTSGTVAARGNNGQGVAGTAYGSRVMPVRALGAGGAGTSYDLDQAVRFAAGLTNDSTTLPEKPADIINLSLGGGPFSQAAQDLYNEVRATGVMVVAAAGNQASAVPGYPASYAGVISVSAVDAQSRLTRYSNTGASIDIAAPGGDNSVDLNGDGYPDGILSTGGSFSDTGLNYEYSFLNGTSMAAPHVAGVLALMKSVNPTLTPADIDSLLAAGALTDDLGAAGRDNQYGHGIINAQRAVLAALEATGSSPADNPLLIASASSLNFGSNTNVLELVLRNGGKGSLQLLDIAVSETWLQVTPLSLDDAGLGTYRVSVDRSNLAAGVYAADITAQSSVNSLSVRVLISVGSAGNSADVGIVYILLYDPITDETVATLGAAANGGSYIYEFTGIAAGQYEIIAGTDADNDQFICDPGEACGSWLTIDQPIRIQLEANTDNIDFPVEYLVSLPSLTGNVHAGAETRPQQSLPAGRKGFARLSGHKDD